MFSSFHENDPGSFARPAPGWSLASHTLKWAPVGSTATSMRPASKIENGSTSTVPPAFAMASAVASASALAM